MLTIAVLYGGRSGEHDVSLCSAASVVAALDPSRYQVVAVGVGRDGIWHVQDSPRVIDHPEFGKVMALDDTGVWHPNHYEAGGRLVMTERSSGRTVAADLVMPVMHGTYCEDGTLQGLLELAMVPFVGADTTGSAVAIDKDVTKRLLRDGGIPVVPWFTVHAREWERSAAELADRIVGEFGFPLFVKPARTGSSVGVGKASDREGLVKAMAFALRFDSKVLVEKGIDAREIECAVLGNESPEASVLGEVVPRHEFYSYEAKYLDPSGAELIIPAPLDAEITRTIRESATQGYSLLCCGGMARVDFFVDRANGQHYLNEINTLPGFTSISMYPKLWEATGLPYSSLIDRLVELALDRYRLKKGLSTGRI